MNLFTYVWNIKFQHSVLPSTVAFEKIGDLVNLPYKPGISN